MARKKIHRPYSSDEAVRKRQWLPRWLWFGRFHKWVVLSLILAALGAVGWRYALGPAYRKWQAGRMMTQAQAAFARGEPTAAALALQKALLYRPYDPAVWRRVAAELERIGAGQALEAWRRAVTLDPHNLAGRLSLARVALEAANLPLAREALLGVSAADQTSVEFHRVAANWARSTGAADEALAHLDAILAKDAQDAQAQFDRAEILLLAGDATARAAGKAKLIELLRRADHSPQKNTVALFAGRALYIDTMRRKAPVEALEYARLLAAAPSATFSDRMLEMDAALAAGNEALAVERLAALQKEAAPDGASLYELTQWMLQRGRANDALKWLRSLSFNSETPAKDRAVGKKKLPQANAWHALHEAAQADCLTLLGRWAELRTLLEPTRWPVQEPLRLVLLARAYRELDDKSRAAGAWRQALEIAGSRIGAMQSLTRTLQTWGWENELEAVLLQAVERFPDQLPVYAQLELLYLRQRDTQALRRILNRHVDAEPGNSGVHANRAMMELLSGADPAPIARALEAFAAKNGFEPRTLTAYAFAKYRQGFPSDAALLLEQLPDALRREPARALYYGLALQKSGQTRTARNYLQLAQKAELLPEERELLVKAMEAAKSE